MNEQDIFRVMKECLLQCKRHRPDLYEILKLEEKYENTIIDYLKNLFYSKETCDLQEFLDQVRKVIDEKKDISK